MLFMSSFLCHDEELTEPLLNFWNPFASCLCKAFILMLVEVLTEKDLGGLPLRLLGCTM